MQNSRLRLVVISVALLIAMMVNLAGCAEKRSEIVSDFKAESLMDGVTPKKVDVLNDLSAQNPVVTDFAVRLFKANAQEGENVLISPLSVLSALAMTVNGAEEDTREQMETVLGMSVEELNLYFYTYMQNLPEEERCKLSLANSVWFTDHKRFAVDQDFLQSNANYYGADIYKAPFNKATLKDINNWVKNRTDDMIPEFLSQIPSGATMYLINALAFDAEWLDIYKENKVRNGEFTKEDGTEQTASFMSSVENLYIEDANATGFLKYYNGGEYAFVALLPNEGVSVADYVASLDGTALNAMLENPQNVPVYATLPRFETEYSTDMAAVLQSMGMTDAFNESAADFSGLGTYEGGNIFIGKVLHKSVISVDKKGTKAGAVTAVTTMGSTSGDPKAKTVCLNRPFVYMLVDCKNNIPFFIGTMMDIEK